MKKWLILILLVLFITGCAKNEHTQSEDSDTNYTKNETSSFSQQESDLIRLNVGQSNYSKSVNLKSDVPGKMCYVQETDTLFFSDKNGLFQRTGEKTVKLLDTPVSALNIAGGNLYFIIPEDENVICEFGKVYRMELSDGKTECIIDEDIVNISVYKDRIFYCKIVDLTNTEDGVISYVMKHSKCGLNGEERTQIFDFAFSFEDDMCITQNGDSINLTNLSDGTVEKIIDEPNGINTLSVYNGYLYYLRMDYSTLMNDLVRVNLADKTVDVLSTSADGDYIEDYGFVGGKLCVCTTTLYLEENGALVQYNGAKNIYKSLYTCGSKVYGICGEKLYELEFVNDREMRSVSETVIGGVGDET